MTADKPRNIGAHKKHFLRCRRFWLRALPVVLLIICLPTLLGILRFGNPQWHKYMYMFQAYVWPVHSDGEIDPPMGYTGVWRMWHPNGRKMVEGKVKRGKKQGMWIWWHPNGQEFAEGKYIDGMEEGKWIWWHDNGRKMSEANYRNGKPHGKWIWWHANGQKSNEGSYRNGKKEGKWTYWDARGNVIKVEHYNNGALARTEKPKQ